MPAPLPVAPAPLGHPDGTASADDIAGLPPGDISGQDLRLYGWACNALFLSAGLLLRQSPDSAMDTLEDWLQLLPWLALPLGLGLAYSRHQRLAAGLLVWGGWLACLGLLLRGHAAPGPLLLLLPVQVATAAWLLGSRSALALCLLGIACLLLRLHQAGGWTWLRQASDPAQAVLAAGCMLLALCVALLSRRGRLWQAQQARATARAWQAQDEELHKLTSLIEQCPIGIVITDPQRRIEYVNPAFIGQAGLPASAFMNLPSELLSTQGLNARQRASLHEAMARGEVWRGEQTVLRPDGSRLVEELEIGPIRRANGEISHWFELKKDITVRRWAADQIERLVYVDTLTQLPNQTALHDRLAQVQHRDLGALSLLLLKLGALGSLNERFGPQAGDACLQQVAAILRRHLPEAANDLYRIGGAEFAIVLPDSLARHEVDACTRRVYQALHQALAQPARRPQTPHGLCSQASVLFGATPFPIDPSDQAGDGLSRARLALRQARHEAPGQPCWYQPRLSLRAQQRQQARDDFGLGDPRQRVGLSLRARRRLSGEACGYWAELQWAEPVPAASCLRCQARSADLAFVLDEELLARLSALDQARPPGQAAPALTLALLSPLLRQHDAVRWLDDCLGRHPLPRHTLTLALGTRDLACTRADEDLLSQRLQALREAGFRLCLRDFGQGLPGLLELPQWPVHEVLLAPPLLRQAGQAGVAALLEAMLEACRAQSLQVVIEGAVPEELARRHPGLIGQDAA